ncbi:membrane-spanning 4-domains subfamily A member 15-like [Rhinatrema bivittatum]|uniref:membrane-spanning 4-domains subfamily A member 15-like n=1 Tax=Rhinatrema bivittatum TaxID=194408 RepID=UPI001126DA90|nr:membrane-spanning 4-domains subfamily A member 15-like [Rhinatrema bivittatum]XP_029431397.1 membrane-spanning 4-domains subfamily A member 15-like [Rhinatrema bivittatum]
MANAANAENVQVITQVLSQNDPRLVQLSQNIRPPPEQRFVPHAIKIFKKSQPIVLGTIQIFLGMTHILFGIIITTADETLLTASSGVYFWTGFLLLISGSLSVTVEKKENIFLVKASLGSNLLSLVAGLVAMIIFSVTINAALGVCMTAEDDTWFYLDCSSMVYILDFGINAIILLFLLLEIAIAACIVAFAWKALKEDRYTQML